MHSHHATWAASCQLPERDHQHLRREDSTTENAGNPAITITMQPPNFTTGLGLVTDDSIVAVLASTKHSNRGPSIEELDSIELPDYGLTKGQSGPPTTSAKDVSTVHQARSAADSQTAPSDLEASPRQSPTFEGSTATSIIPSVWYPAMDRWRVLAACLGYFANGINDSVVGVIVFQLLAWFIPNVINGAAAVGFLGFLLGPAYKCVTTVFARLLPAEIQMSTIAFV
jgi:hypothetical protein